MAPTSSTPLVPFIPPMPMVMFWLVALLHPTPASALTSAEEWSDFADNFATDLAPLITLFGEQVTKQFLSESTGFLDNVIFGLAPLGILTAVVSAIRLYGKASLKSFIGRAQEAHGVAEAELCSSTSYDVCELWSNGGICRVFGRPKILEFIYTKGGNFYPTDFFRASNHDPPHCGIYPTKEILAAKAPDGSSDRWHEDDAPPPWTGRMAFAPYPNLSLNVGTQSTKKRVLLGVAAFGLLLQSSLFVYATWATFYNPSFYTDDDRPQLWSFVLGMAGTLLLVCGMTVCAALVERRSIERRFRHVPHPDGVKPRIYWLQCGDQRVGDQQFRSFAYSKEKKEYVTSHIDRLQPPRILGLQTDAALLLAITSSLLGFACQFVGFRGLHGSVALYQLACTLVMSIIRAWLRSRRLSRDQNRVEFLDRKSESDELDWQALDIISREECPGFLVSACFLHSWRLDTGLQRSAMSEASQSGGAQILVSDDEIGSGIAGFAPADDSPPEEDREAACARSAVSLVRVLEGDIRRDNAVFPGPLYIYPVTGESPEFSRNLASRALYVRARLGHLTGDPLQPPGSQWDAELQGVARRLQTALQDAAGYIFRDAPLKDGGWKRAKALTWSAACELTIHTLGVSLSSAFPIHFIMRQQGQRWLIDEYLLAAVMGLWRYSILNSARHADIHMFASRQYPKRKFIEAAISLEHTAAVVRLWVTKDSALEHASYESPRPELGAPTFMLSTDTSMGALSPSSTQWEPYRDGQFAGQDHAERSGVLLLSVQTRASLLEMMAQDIFSTFMFETASIMDNLSEVCVRQQPGSSGESILRNPNATSSELGNVHIDTLARILCDSGLATEEAALMSIVPTFFHHGKLPSLDASIASLLNDAKQLRSDGQYQQGEAHLKSLLRICSPDHHEKVVRALGELCREASRSPSEFHRDFGLRAMASLRQLTRQGVTALSEPAVTALKDYQQLSEILKEDPRHSGKPWEAKPPPPLDMTSVAELRQDMELPRDKRPRLKALLMLEKYDIGGRNSLAVQEFLFVAIALGYAEVIEDLRALNPSLLFELPFSEVPSGEGEPLTVVVQKKFNPGGEAEFLDSNGKEPKGSLRPGAPIVFLATVWAASQLEQEDRAPGEAEDVLRTMLSWASITNDLTDGQKNTPLMYAVSSGNLAAVDILLEYGVDFQVRNTAGETALSRAVANDCLSIAESILKEGQRAGGLSHGYLHHALALAFRLRKREFIEILLRHGADINELDERGKTLLLAAMEPFLADAAAVQNQPHIIKIWRRRDGRGSGDPKLVSLLIEYGAMVGQEVLGVMLQTALDIVEPDWIRQLHARDYNVVGWLNEKGALAAVLEHPEDGHYAQPLVKVLLELGVTVQPGDVNLAVRFPSRDGILDLVLETRPPTDGVLKDYGTPVQTVLNNTSWPSGYAPEQEKKLEILIAAGCDVNLDSPEWKASPLQIICARSTLYTQPLAKFPEVAVASKDNLASILLRAGAKTNLTAADIPGEEGRVIRSTPLELACLTGKADLVQALLDAGADVNAPGGEFGSPLQAACMQFGQRNEDSVAIIRTLLAAGANVNAISAPCGTALAAATHSLLPDVVQVLLDAGANPSLEITDHASGAYYDAWDALHQPHGRLIESLRETFKGMQTGPFTCIPLSYDSAGGRWELIRKLLTQHGGGAIRPGMEEKACPAMYLQERVQTICAQDEFKRLSPEEIRWRHRWRPNQTSAAPRADAADSKSPTDPLPFYGFIGLGGGVGKEPVAVQHISSQHPYHEHSAEEVRLWDYDAGLRYPPKKSSQTPEEKVTHGFSLDIEVVPSVFSSTSVQRGGFGSFGTDNNAPTGLFGSSSGGGLFRSAGFRVTPQAGSSGQGGFGGAAGGLSGTGTSGGSLFGTAPSGGLSRAASTSGGSLFGGNSLLDWLSGTGDSSGTSLFGSSSGQGGLFRLPTTPTRSSSLFGSSSVGTGFGTSSASATPFGPGTGQGELADASSGLSIGSSLEHGGLSTGGLDASDSAQAGLVGKGPGAGPVGSDPIGVGAENIEGPLQVPCDDADLASTVSKILESTVEIRKADSEA